MDGYVVVLLYIHFLCFMVRNFWRLREKLNARTKSIDETNEQTDRQTHQQQSTIATWKWYQTKANNSHLPGLHGRCFPNKNKTETKTIALWNKIRPSICQKQTKTYYSHACIRVQLWDN